jgi:hypothetical protein
LERAALNVTQQILARSDEQCEDSGGFPCRSNRILSAVAAWNYGTALINAEALVRAQTS